MSFIFHDLNIKLIWHYTPRPLPGTRRGDYVNVTELHTNNWRVVHVKDIKIEVIYGI